MTSEPDHYFSSQPQRLSKPRSVNLALSDGVFTLTSDTGVFSYGQIDPGTRLLLRNMPLPPTAGDIADVGCGYGAISVVAATRCRDRTIWAVDVNERALELTTTNAKAAGLVNVRPIAAAKIPHDLRVAAVYSNPPLKIGKIALHSLLDEWLARLLPNGAMYLVIPKHLGANSLARWLVERGQTVTKIARSGGYHVLAATPAVTTD